MVFKIDVFFVSLKEEIPNKSVSEILGSLPLKTFSSMLRMLLKKINLSSEKIIIITPLTVEEVKRERFYYMFLF